MTPSIAPPTPAAIIEEAKTFGPEPTWDWNAVDDRAQTYVQRLRQRLAHGRGGPGNPLYERLDPGARPRMDATLFMERSYLTRGDDPEFGPLVFAGCQLLERALGSMLVPPSLDHRNTLLAVADGDCNEVLGLWYQGTLPMTLGTLQVLTRVWCSLAITDAQKARDLLSGVFEPEYVALLTTCGPERCLERIRTVFRNPVAHETKSCDLVAYQTFVELLLGTATFDAWLREFPEAVLADLGCLHHHLVHLRPRSVS